MNKAFFIIVLIWFCAFSAFAQSVASVRVNAETVVSSDVVMLGAIAQVSGDAAQVERLKTIALGYAPQIGMTREIGKEKIRLAICAAGFSANEFALVSPSAASVKRASQTVENTVLREAVESAVLSDLQTSGATAARLVRLDLPPQPFELPNGKIAVRTVSSPPRDLFRPFALTLEILIDNRAARRFAATVQIEAFAEVLVAKRDFAANEKIAETDFKLENCRLEKPLAEYLRDARKLKAALAARNLSRGAALTKNAIIAGYAVRSGDAIKVVAKSGELQIIVAGIARASGRIGDRIAIKNEQSGANLQAVVVDEGLVQINF